MCFHIVAIILIFIIIFWVALSFHQYGASLSSWPMVILYGLTLLVLYFVLRGLSAGTLVFPSHEKPTLILIWYVVIQFDLQSPQFIKPMCSAKSIETSISYYCYRYYYYYYYYYHYYYYYYIIIRGVFVINSTSNNSFICMSLRYNYWKA